MEGLWRCGNDDGKMLGRNIEDMWMRVFVDMELKMERDRWWELF